MERDRRGTEAGSAEMQRAVDCRIGIERRNLKVEAGVRGDRPHSRAGEGQPGDSAEKTFFPSLLCPPSPPAPVCRGQVPSP